MVATYCLEITAMDVSFSLPDKAWRMVSRSVAFH